MTIEELQKKIEALEAWKKTLESPETIPIEFDRSLRYRFNLDAAAGVSLSNVAASTYNDAVDEGGEAQYEVLSGPDALLQITIAGITYKVPAYL